MMSDLPSMAHAFVILSLEDKQREVKPHNHTVLDSTSLAASTSTSSGKGFNTNYSSYSGIAGNPGGTNKNRASSFTNSSY